MAHSLDVLKFYEQDVKPAIEKNSNEYIQNLIKTADFNHDSVSKFENSIAKDSKQIDAYNKRIINKSWFGGLLWFFLIAAITTIGIETEIGGKFKAIAKLSAANPTSPKPWPIIE